MTTHATFKGSDRRVAPRYACDVPLSCRTQGQTFRGRLLDLSSTGARVWLSQPVSTGLLVDVVGSGPGSRGALKQGQVVWSRPALGGYESGVHFGHDLTHLCRDAAAAGLLTERRVRSRRLDERVKARIPASILGGDSPDSGRTEDLSLGGARLQVNTKLAPGDRVDVRIGPFQGLTAVTIQARVIEARLRPPQARPKDGDWLCRLEFERGSPAEVFALARYLSRVRRLQRARQRLHRRPPCELKDSAEKVLAAIR